MFIQAKIQKVLQCEFTLGKAALLDSTCIYFNKWIYSSLLPICTKPSWTWKKLSNLLVS